MWWNHHKLQVCAIGIKIVIGGACTSEDLCREMGADDYGETAIDALRIFNKYVAST